MYASRALPFPKPIVQRPQTTQHKLFFSRHGFFSVPQRVSESRFNSRKGHRLGVVMCVGSQNKKVVEPEDESFEDGYYMRRCVELAEKAIGRTNPNPMVGCVIVKDGKIVGEGFHPKAGEPHAEVFALRDAGDQAENGTAYVSLEPCNHYGRTPPCTGALIKAKVKNVVVGMVDPNPMVASTWVKRLREGGTNVTVGVEEESCRRLNEVFVHHILTKTHFLTEGLLREGLEFNLFQKVAVEVLPILGGGREKLTNCMDLNTKAKKLILSSISGQSVLLEGYF